MVKIFRPKVVKVNGFYSGVFMNCTRADLVNCRKWLEDGPIRGNKQCSTLPEKGKLHLL